MATFPFCAYVLNIETTLEDVFLTILSRHAHDDETRDAAALKNKEEKDFVTVDLGTTIPLQTNLARTSIFPG